MAPPCQVRTDTFDRNGRRTHLSATDHSDGDCTNTSTTDGTVSVSTDLAYAYDTADRPTVAATGTRDGTAVPAAGTAGTYSYDAFGRQLLIPAADAPNPANGDITLGYYDDDLARTITQGATATTLALDASGRRTLATTTDTSTTPTGTSTLERHYTDAGDNPAWTVATDTAGNKTTTRYSESLGGDLAATISSDGAAQLTLANLHGDVVTAIDIPTTQTSSDPATSITGWADYTEYGTPRDGAATAAVAGTAGYGWLGAKQRSTTTDTAGLTLMGDRLYNPAVGAFTSTDPEPGGNTTAYTYPQDPINAYDLDGHRKHKRWSFWKVVSVVTTAATVASLLGCAVCGAVAVIGSGMMAVHDYRSRSYADAAMDVAGVFIGGRAVVETVRAARAARTARGVYRGFRRSQFPTKRAFQSARRQARSAARAHARHLAHSAKRWDRASRVIGAGAVGLWGYHRFRRDAY